MENSTELWHLIYSFLNYQKMLKLIITIMFQALQDFIYIHIFACFIIYFLKIRKQRLRENKGYAEESGFKFTSVLNVVR